MPGLPGSNSEQRAVLQLWPLLLNHPPTAATAARGCSNSLRAPASSRGRIAALPTAARAPRAPAERGVCSDQETCANNRTIRPATSTVASYWHRCLARESVGRVDLVLVRVGPALGADDSEVVSHPPQPEQHVRNETVHLSRPVERRLEIETRLRNPVTRGRAGPPEVPFEHMAAARFRDLRASV